jgi:hypothetical protein
MGKKKVKAKAAKAVKKKKVKTDYSKISRVSTSASSTENRSQPSSPPFTGPSWTALRHLGRDAGGRPSGADMHEICMLMSEENAELRTDMDDVKKKVKALYLALEDLKGDREFPAAAADDLRELDLYF